MKLGELMEKLGLGRASPSMEKDFRTQVWNHYAERTDEEQAARITRLAMTVKERRGISLEELCAGSGMDFSEVVRIATTLECDGFISMDLLQHCSIRMRKR